MIFLSVAQDCGRAAFGMHSTTALFVTKWFHVVMKMASSLYNLVLFSNYSLRLHYTIRYTFISVFSYYGQRIPLVKWINLPFNIILIFFLKVMSVTSLDPVKILKNNFIGIEEHKATRKQIWNILILRYLWISRKWII